MKGVDIKTDGTAYKAKIDYSASGKVTVIEKGIARRHGYRSGTQHNGVRVRLAAPVRRAFVGSGNEYPEGSEYIIATRDIEREWTPSDEARLLADREGAARAASVTERLVAAGFGVGWGSDVSVARDGGATFTADALERLLGRANV